MANSIQTKGNLTFGQAALAILLGEGDPCELNDFDAEKYAYVEMMYEAMNDCAGDKVQSMQMFRAQLNAISKNKHGVLAYAAPRGTLENAVHGQISDFFSIVSEAIRQQSPSEARVQQTLAASQAYKMFLHHKGLASNHSQRADSSEDEGDQKAANAQMQLSLANSAEARRWFELYTKIKGYPLAQEETPLDIPTFQIMLSDDPECLSRDNIAQIDHYFDGDSE